MSSELKVDTISEKTSANGVVIDGVTVKDGGIAKSFITGGTGITLQAVYQHAAISVVSAGLAVHIAGLDITITPASTSS